jgi:hypothetical protein
MNPETRLKRTTPLLLSALLIVCLELSPKHQAASPPPRENYPTFNTVKRQKAPFTPAGGGWNIVPSPNTGSPNNYLFGVAAIASNDVWAVGAYGELGTAAQQLVEHWDGTSWTHVASPSLAGPNELLAVSAVAASDVWAVGGYDSGGQALIQHWDGSTWNVVPNPNPGTFNRFFGVAAISSNNVWAVGITSNGGLSQTLIEHWNGTNWSVIPSPNIPDQHNQLNAVTAVPGAPNELWAVGEAGPSALILHWDGTQWSIVPSPTAGTVPKLLSVVAIAVDDVWAVGWTGGNSGPVTLTMHWDGSTWSVVPSPNPSATDNFLRGVTALAPDNVWAVGEFNAPGGNQRTLFLRWNGTAWEQVAGENTGPNGVQFFLSAVSAISGSDIWAVGNNSHSLAEHWNGTSWSIVSTPNAGVGENILNGVSGSASNDVWQVGYYAFGTWKQTLTEHWNGAEWSIVPSPNTNNRLNELKGVAAISASNAWAVGNAHSGQAPPKSGHVGSALERNSLEHHPQSKPRVSRAQHLVCSGRQFGKRCLGCGQLCQYRRLLPDACPALGRYQLECDSQSECGRSEQRTLRRGGARPCQCVGSGILGPFIVWLFYTDRALEWLRLEHRDQSQSVWR